MDKATFLQHFQLFPLVVPPILVASPALATSRQAGVLVPIVVNEQLNVVFTVRADHLKHHPGQICFPGGKIEPSDDNIITTALRETHEEIGIKPKHIQILGQLQARQTLTGFVISPVVGLIDHQYANYQLDMNEVTEVFSIPLAFILNPKNYQTINTLRQGRHHNVTFIRYKHYNIWGATAAILQTLCQHFQRTA